MEIIHHFGLKISSEEDARKFSILGIQLERGPRNLPGSSIASFEISELDRRWEEVQRVAEKYKITEFERTRFSKSELNSSNALCMLASVPKGYLIGDSEVTAALVGILAKAASQCQ